MKTDFVVAGFIVHNDRLLLIHHNKLNLWLPPGGHIDANETPDAALHREILEETGISIEILNRNDIPPGGNVRHNLAVPFFANVHSVGDHDHCCFYYLCRALNPEVLKINEEVKASAWFSGADLHKPIVPVDVRNMGLKAFELYGRLIK